MSAYNRFPATKIQGYEQSVICKEESILQHLQQVIKPNSVLCVECYPGVEDEPILSCLKKLNPQLFLNMRECLKDKETIQEQLSVHLTEDRIFGKMYYGELVDFLDKGKLNEAKKKVHQQTGFTIIYGFGATLIHPGDLLIYLDLARWEIQQRYRQGMPNYFEDKAQTDPLQKIKQGYYIEWRIADKHKMTCFQNVDYFLDTHDLTHWKLVSGEAVRKGLQQIAGQPFRTVPYFDPGVWGGQWMKKVCKLDPKEKNYAWSFDGVPEENSLYLDFGSAQIELPCMDLILNYPKEVLGEQVYFRFGAEFPIRFDFLDTMEGQNLSLQVHPLTDYIHRHFGMTYTQDESYYILDAKEDASVYLGLKENIDAEEMIEELESANRKECLFNAEKYINRFPAKKHDHFLIPAGTCHASGKNTMVLEISATPYLFTFKLWDWGRLGLDGKPRPIHIEHGKQVIQWDRTTKWIEENCVNAIKELNRNEHYIEEHTGLHELEFIETRRLWIQDEVRIENHGNMNMLNLIEGEECFVESLDHSFKPFKVHYAETFIVPASVKGYKIINKNKERIGIIRAYVRC